jgi:hypothetical protein
MLVATRASWWRRAKSGARRVWSAVKQAGELLTAVPVRGAILLAAEVLIALDVVSHTSVLPWVDATLLAADTAALGRRRPAAGPLVVWG